ncbi:sensor histidine kinase [Chitinimonas lacunae]|uniref:histidine kinase n=1 Tax=Chitinimonas lacunae TaxID=1963018 RepID=A0ABV8MNV7_9NEIS
MAYAAAVTASTPWVMASPARLGSLLFLVISVCLLCFATVVEFISQPSLETDAIQRNRTLASMTNQAVRMRFDGLASYTQLFSRRPTLVDAVERGDAEAVTSQLASFVSSHPLLIRASITDRDGQLRFDYPVDRKTHGLNLSQRDWYQGAQRLNAPYLSALYFRAASPQIYVTSIATPLRSNDGRLLGYLSAQQSLDDLVRWIAQLPVIPGSHLALIDQTGQMIDGGPRPRSPSSWQNHPEIGRALAGESGDRIGPSPFSGRPAISYYAPIQPYGWAVLVTQETEQVFALLRMLQSQLVWLALLLGLALWPFAYLAARTLFVQRRQSEQTDSLLNGIIEGSDDLIAVIDHEGRLLTFNRAWSEVIARTIGRHPRSGQRLDDLLDKREGSHAPLLEAWHKALKGTPDSTTARLGTEPFRTYEIRTTPLYDPKGRPLGAAATGRDISDRLAGSQAISTLNQRLTQRAAELEATNKELESFSYSVSHDLRSPLRAIDGFSRMLARRAGPRLDDEDRRLLAVVRDNCQVMARLIDDLLTFSRLSRQALSQVEIDMNKLVNEVWSQLGENYPGTIEIEPLPPAHGDRALLKQVWANLLDNAIKYSAPSPQPYIKVSGLREDGECRYLIQDNGVGFDMRYVHKLFGVFQRLHAGTSFPGTGVGLAIVARVVARHGGRVWGEGEPGVGATFGFTLPAAMQTMVFASEGASHVQHASS